VLLAVVVMIALIQRTVDVPWSDGRRLSSVIHAALH